MLAQVILIVIAAMYILSAFLTISAIGKPRKPVTPNLAVTVVVAQLLYAVGLLYVYGQL